MARNDIQIRYVQPHGKARRYRRIVPADVREAIGRGVWIKTFRSATPLAEIEHVAGRLAREHDLQIKRARNGEFLDQKMITRAEELARETLAKDRPDKIWDLQFFDDLHTYSHEPAPWIEAYFNALKNDGHYVHDALTLTAAYARDLELYGGDRAEKVIEYAIRSFVDLIGDKAVQSITRADVAEWLAALGKRGLAPATIRRRIGPLRAIVNRLFLDLDFGGRNPFGQHEVKGSAPGADDRLPLSRAMLDRIDAYLGNSGRLGHETRNILQIMKCTGGGPAEIGGLTLSDVILDAPIPHIWIRTNAIRGLKTGVRNRRLPLVGEALAAARDAYRRAAVRSKGVDPDECQVFAGFGTMGRGADAISAKLNRAIRNSGVPKSPRLVSYSLRHTLKEALRIAGVADHVQRRILGHTGDGVADRYGSPSVRLTEARDALLAAMDHLGDVDAAIFTTKERI